MARARTAVTNNAATLDHVVLVSVLSSLMESGGTDAEAVIDSDTLQGSEWTLPPQVPSAVRGRASTGKPMPPPPLPSYPPLSFLVVAIALLMAGLRCSPNRDSSEISIWQFFFSVCCTQIPVIRDGRLIGCCASDAAFVTSHWHGLPLLYFLFVMGTASVCVLGLVCRAANLSLDVGVLPCKAAHFQFTAHTLFPYCSTCRGRGSGGGWPPACH